MGYSVEKNCLVCGKAFMTSVPNQKYCSGECNKIGFQQTQKKYLAKKKAERQDAKAKKNKQKSQSLMEQYFEARRNGCKLTYGYWVVEHERAEQEAI